ncbi:24411_t:CDS:1, partial [Cetraspora pellucida]
MNTNCESFLFSADTNITNNDQLNKKQKLGGPNFDKIWQYFIQGKNKGQGYYEAKCHYCKSFWACGRPCQIKAHLANYCEECPENISNYWWQKLADEINNYTQNTHESSSEPLPLEIINQIDKSLIKAWVMAGFPFETIENPFVKDFLRNLNSKYTSPSRTTLFE